MHGMHPSGNVVRGGGAVPNEGLQSRLPMPPSRLFPCGPRPMTYLPRAHAVMGLLNEGWWGWGEDSLIWPRICMRLTRYH